MIFDDSHVPNGELRNYISSCMCMNFGKHFLNSMTLANFSRNLGNYNFQLNDLINGLKYWELHVNHEENIVHTPRS